VTLHEYEKKVIYNVGLVNTVFFVFKNIQITAEYGLKYGLMVKINHLMQNLYEQQSSEVNIHLNTELQNNSKFSGLHFQEFCPLVLFQFYKIRLKRV
jgi:hypothetical protein